MTDTGKHMAHLLKVATSKYEQMFLADDLLKRSPEKLKTALRKAYEADPIAVREFLKRLREPGESLSAQMTQGVMREHYNALINALAESFSVSVEEIERPDMRNENTRKAYMKDLVEQILQEHSGGMKMVELVSTLTATLYEKKFEFPMRDYLDEIEQVIFRNFEVTQYSWNGRMKYFVYKST